MAGLPMLPAFNALRSNLGFALLFAPADKRRDLLSFYDFCREVDDLADLDHLPRNVRAQRLADFEKALASGDLGGLPAAFAEIVNRRNLDTSLLAEIVRGALMDFDFARYSKMADLELYCRRVACAVGIITLQILGCDEPASRGYANQLGLGLQMVNILRDIGEDAGMGRVYLPLELLHRHGIRADDLAEGSPGPSFVPMLHEFANAAREHLHLAREHLPPLHAKPLRIAELMRRVYGLLLSKMERDGFRVFVKRYRVTPSEKARLAVKTFLGNE